MDARTRTFEPSSYPNRKRPISDSGRILAAAFVLLAALAIAVPGLRAAPSRSTDEGRLARFHEICRGVEERFYDASFVRRRFPAIRRRWQERIESLAEGETFAEEINAMLAELKASHCHYYTADDPRYHQLLSIFAPMPAIRALLKGKTPSYPSVGIDTERRKGKVFVRSVFEGGAAERAGMRRGDEILSVDGAPFRPVASFRDKVGRAVSIAIRRHRNGPLRKVDVIPVLADPKEEFLAAERASVRLVEVGNEKVGVVHVLNYAGEAFHEAFLDALLGPLKKADALVWDLRDGWGGADPSFLNVFNRKVPVLSSTGRDGKTRSYDPQWRKPVIMLVNDGVRSGKEVLAHAFRRHGLGLVLGERTAGAVLGGTPIVLSDGSVLYLAAAAARVDGMVLEGRGVAPHVEVPMPLEYSAGADPQLEKALEILGRGMGKAP